MKHLNRLLAVASAAFFIAGSALAQNAGTVSLNAFAIGLGPGVQGFKSVLCTGFAVGTGSGAAPTCRVIQSSDIPASVALTGAPTAPTAAVDTNTTQIATTAYVIAQAAGATPLIDGAAAVGVSTRFARGDHVHPTDTTRSPVASPTFTGIPAAPTAAVDTNTTQLATTAFMLAQAASASPLADAAAAIGTSTRFARADHVHPFPAMTGDVTSVLGAVATTIAPNAVTNAKMATMAAFTFKGNNTSGSATPTDVDIAALTAKASPVATDLVMISDQAASGAWKKVTISSLASAGSVASIAGNTGAFTLSNGIKNVTNDIQADPVFHRSYLAGLTLSTAGASATFGIAAGVAVDSTNAGFMSLASAYTKTTGAWVVGTANGALDTGAIANSTWYHVYEIKRPDTGVVDVAISLSASAPTTGGAIPAAYTLFRRIGSMKTNGSAQWMQFNQLGDEFLWASPPLDFSVAAVGNGTATIFTLISVPTGVQVNALIEGYTSGAASGTQVYFSSLDQTDIATPNGTSSIITGSFGALKLNLRTSTSATIRGRANGASLTVNASVLGWIDTRGRNN